MPVTRRKSSAAGFNPITPTGNSTQSGSDNAQNVTSPKARRPAEVFQIQALAPAPSQTTYQLVIKDNDEVELRDWPKKRYSEKWTRNSLMNPGSVKVSFKDYSEGVLEDKVKSIFGPQVYDQTIRFLNSFEKEKSQLAESKN